MKDYSKLIHIVNKKLYKTQRYFINKYLKMINYHMVTTSSMNLLQLGCFNYYLLIFVCTKVDSRWVGDLPLGFNESFL